MGINWSAWRLDLATWGWIVILLAALVWEFWWVAQDPKGTLTWHLRPVFHSAPVMWYMGLGFWLWLGPHFFFPELERRIAEIVGS